MITLEIFELIFYKKIKYKQRSWLLLFYKKQLNKMDILKVQKYCEESQYNNSKNI